MSNRKAITLSYVEHSRNVAEAEKQVPSKPCGSERYDTRPLNILAVIAVYGWAPRCGKSRPVARRPSSSCSHFLSPTTFILYYRRSLVVMDGQLKPKVRLAARPERLWGC